jgi:lysophospholipase L1-like esterase
VARRSTLVACAVAIVIVGTGLMGAGYLFGVKHAHWPMFRPLVRVPLVRAYLFDPPLRHLLQVIADQEEDQGVFASVWDTNTGALMSKRLFQGVDMYSVRKYRYKPNLKKLMFRAGPPGFDHEMETEDTPAIRAALEHVYADFVPAAYDQAGFRRVDAELSRDCDAHVLFLGDSFTDGMWVNDSDTFVNRYGHLVRDRSPLRICPVNAGVNGYGSLEESYVLEHDFDAAGRPSLVFLMYFPNDVDADYVAVIDGTVADAGRKWAESLAYVRRAAAFSREHGAALVLAAIPPVEQLSRPSTRANYQDLLRRFCETEAIPFVDLLAELESGEHQGLYWDWDPHFTPRGHARVAEILFQQSRSLPAAARAPR